MQQLLLGLFAAVFGTPLIAYWFHRRNEKKLRVQQEQQLQELRERIEIVENFCRNHKTF